MDAIPQKPSTLDPRAVALLEWMGAQPWAHLIVLGGGVALKHYLDYRGTKDCDAWWDDAVTAEQRQFVMTEISAALSRLNPGSTLRSDNWGEVNSVSVVESGKVVFSFQVAQRTTQLAPYLKSSWGGVRIESLEDNIASKMSAFVDRGLGRDFSDVYQLYRQLGWTPVRLWELWQKKNPERRLCDAQAQAKVKFEVLVRSRPLEKIAGDSERSEVAAARAWLQNELLAYDSGH
jgi:hypothetical protein